MHSKAASVRGGAVALLCLLLSLFGAPAALAALTLNPASVTVAVGGTATSAVSGAGRRVRVESEKDDIARASYANGVITVQGRRPGSTTIRVRSGDDRARLAVTVVRTPVSNLQVTPPSVSVAVGASAQATVSGAAGTVSVQSQNPAVATAALAGTTITVTGVAAGSTTVAVSDGQRTVSLGVAVSTSQGGSNDGIPVSGPGANFVVLSANDLGMHCTDQDFQIFSILPPFNSMHTQVVRKGATPALVDGAAVDVYYAAASNASDPAGAGSINTTSANAAGIFKSNFWQAVGNQTLGSLGYRSLYPAQNCATPPCDSVLDLFSPLPGDVGLPVPDPNVLPNLEAHQQTVMSVLGLAPYNARPYLTNTAQPVHRFDADLAFFKDFPFGATLTGVNWFAADGIPMLPVDDLGRSNAYPLARVAAVSKGGSPHSAADVLAALDIVLPVASEADCQNCHASLADSAQSPAPLNGRAADFASVTAYSNGTTWRVATTADADVPGPEKLLNAAKVNVLRLHDAKHGAHYVRSDTGASDACLSGSEDSCLDRRRTIQCSQCHYSPALDLAQVGPIDEPDAGRFGRQQTRHISMSSAMHGFHGKLQDDAGQSLFPAMPAPGTPERAAANVEGLLGETCYQCHPGKRTKCLRGAMATGGVVCQDCHGDMRQVGNDFTASFPSRPGSADLTKRVPWANEPKCQSCHIGDAVSVQAINRSDMIVAADGIRLSQAFTRTAAAQPVLANIQAPASRFAENASLYRLSSGHGGVMCKACHGATHAEWPNALAGANDNVAANQLQGHTGTIVECSVCHTAGSIGNNSLGGPHGMHVVNDSRFANGGHEDLAERNPNACRACHGQRGEGTVLSRVAATRTFDNRTLVKGTPVTCSLCHRSPL